MDDRGRIGENRAAWRSVERTRSPRDKTPTQIRSKAKLPVGKAKVEVESRLVDKIGGPMDVTLRVNGEVVGQGRVPAAMSLHFTSNATFDIGTDLDSPVSLDYYDQAPFAFNGTIGTTKITYLKQ